MFDNQEDVCRYDLPINASGIGHVLMEPNNLFELPEGSVVVSGMETVLAPISPSSLESRLSKGGEGEGRNTLMTR